MTAFGRTLADEWKQYSDIWRRHGYPDEVITGAFEALFYAGATATLALLTNDVNSGAIERELELYAALHLDWPPIPTRESTDATLPD